MELKELLENRINEFWGYGNLKSDIWFVGMEEGFKGGSELETQLNKTNEKSVIDIKDMENVEAHMQWFNVKPKLQRTWSKLIIILLMISNQSNPDNESIRSFQKDGLGSKNGNHCLLDLMPLSSKSTTNWMYSDCGLDYLESRKSYLKKVSSIEKLV